MSNSTFTYENQSSTFPIEVKDNKSHLLWIPYILLGAALLIFYSANFILYHYKNRERYKARKHRRKLIYDYKQTDDLEAALRAEEELSRKRLSFYAPHRISVKTVLQTERMRANRIHVQPATDTDQEQVPELRDSDIDFCKDEVQTHTNKDINQLYSSNVCAEKNMTFSKVADEIRVTKVPRVDSGGVPFILQSRNSAKENSSKVSYMNSVNVWGHALQRDKSAP